VDKRREKYRKKNREGNAINGFAAMAGANPFIIRGTKCAAGRQSLVSRRRCRWRDGRPAPILPLPPK
jgi:hypothetical protein